MGRFGVRDDRRTAVSTGEDSSPPPPDYPTSVSEPPAALVAKAAETALEQGIQALRGTALLPPATALTPLPAPTSALALLPTPADAPASGRILDVDGDTLLIGLGTTDGLTLGDALLVVLPDGRTVRVVTTRRGPADAGARTTKTIAAERP